MGGLAIGHVITMNIYDLFRSEEAALPKKRTEEDFQKYVREMFDGYRGKLNSLNATDGVTEDVLAKTDDILILSKAIERAIQYYFDGHPQKAHVVLAEGVSAALEPFGGIPGGGLREPYPLPLYRIRIRTPKELVPPTKKEDIFHIPFQSRHKVASQRYSIPGFPCLYLGGSLYTCWKELRLPSHWQKELYVSAFWLKGKDGIRVLDLGSRPKRLASAFESWHDNPSIKGFLPKLTLQAVLWPLTAACSIKVMHPESTFKPEHIVPQLLLQWLRTVGKFDAIRYASTHIDDEPACVEGPHKICNYVFPIKTIKVSGHCADLWSMFDWTVPVSWQSRRKIREEAKGVSVSCCPNHMHYQIDTLPHEPLRYDSSSFGCAELALHKRAMKENIIDNEFRGPLDGKYGPCTPLVI